MRKIIFYLILFVCSIGSVNAKTIFTKEWQTSEYKTTIDKVHSGWTSCYENGVYNSNCRVEYDFNYLIYTNYDDYKDGFITSYEIYDEIEGKENTTEKIDGWETKVTYYDKIGKIIKSNSDYDFTIDDLVVINDKIYVLAFDSDTNEYFIKILNDDLVEVKSTKLNNYVKHWETYMRKIYGLDFLVDKQDGNLLVYSGYYYYVIDYDLENDSYNSTMGTFLESESFRYSVLSNINRFVDDKNYVYISANNEDNYTVLSGAYYDSNNCENDMCKTSAVVSAFDYTNELVWKIEKKEYLSISDVQLLDNYLIGIGAKYDNDKLKDYIVVLDMEGNIVQEIKIDDNLFMLKRVNDGFMITSYKDLDSNDLVKYHTEYYSYGNYIYTKTDGNGKIEVQREAKKGDLITYKIIPTEGYDIDKIIIIDEEGNNILVDKLTFVMPRADVTIEATFKKKINNPNTSTFEIGITILGFGIIFLGYTIFVRKKLKWLR